MRNAFFGNFAGGWPPWTGMAFGRRSRFFESGEFRLAILSLLSEGPKHGYQLMKELAERSGGVYKASAGSVYPTLQQLEDEGLVEAALIGGRRVYTLTPAGRAELERDPETVRRIWERAESCEDWGQWMGAGTLWIWGPLGDLFKAGLKAGSRIGARGEGADRIREILERARRELDAL
jgi:DNA-binding PadR family transcriptional regulator